MILQSEEIKGWCSHVESCKENIIFSLSVIQQQFQDESMRNLIVILSLKLKLPQQERGWMPLTKYVRSKIKCHFINSRNNSISLHTSFRCASTHFYGLGKHITHITRHSSFAFLIFINWLSFCFTTQSIVSFLLSFPFLTCSHDEFLIARSFESSWNFMLTLNTIFYTHFLFSRCDNQMNVLKNDNWREIF